MPSTPDQPDGDPVRLPPPFEHITVTYPYQWAQPNRVHVFDEHEGTGTLYSPEWASALAGGILESLEGPGHWTSDGSTR